MSAPAAVGCGKPGLDQQRHAGRYMTQFSLAQKLTPGSGRPLEAFWGADYETLSRECEAIIARQYGFVAVADPAPSSTKPAATARTPRKPTLTSVAKQVSKAGIEVARYEVKPDGTVVVVTGAPTPVDTENPWDEVLPSAPKTYS